MRFLEFTKVWKSTKIGEIADIVGGGTPRTEVEEYWDGEIKWFTPSEIGKTKYIFDSKRHITDKGLKNSSAKLLPKDTILLSSRATVGEISIALTECSTNQGFQSLITKNNVDNDFIYYLISTIKNEFLRRSSGSTFLEISKNEIKRIPINIPELSEQNKISNLFSAIDNKIEMLEKKHQYYQDFKKYLMQRIFSSQDDKLRFAKFDYEWVDYPLKDIGKIITGTTPSTKNKDNFSDNGYLWVTPGDISNKRIVTSTERNLSKEGLNNGRELPPNSILVTCIGATIGKICMIKKVGSCNQQLNAIIPNEQFDPDFIYYIIQYNAERLKLIAGNTATPILNKKSFGNIKFEFPKLKEQQKISRLLTSMDDAIDNIESGIKNIQYFKNGLLQQMFVVQLILSLLQNKKHI